MAFIPDDAEDRFHELSPSAERFYIFLCKHRNHKAKKSFGNLETCAQKYGWGRATKFGLVKELTNGGWIEKDGSAWLLLVGDFSPMDKKEKSKNLDFQTETESVFLDSESKNLDYQSKKLDEKSKNLDFQTETESVFLDSESKNLDYQSKKLDEKSKNLDSHIRNIPALPEIKPEEENTHTAPASNNSIYYEIFKKYFPGVELNDFQQGLLKTRISDAEIFKEALDFWAGNDHIARNVFNICKKFDELLLEKSGNITEIKPNDKTDKNRTGKYKRSDQKTDRTTEETLSALGATPADF